MTRAKHDPLEAAKAGDAAGNPAPVARKTPAREEAPAAAPPPTPPVVARRPAPSAPSRRFYRVTRTHVCSLGGNITTLVAGDVIDAIGYGGEPGVRRLIADGVPLEAVE